MYKTMITIKFKGKEYKIKNSIKELTIGEFEDILIIFNKENNIVEKWFEVFKLLGMTEEILLNIDINEFKSIVREFDFNTSNIKIKKTIKLNGVEYKSYDSSFKLIVKNVLMIEDYLLVNQNKYIAEVIAILYTNKEEGRLNNKLIKEKAVLIREQINAEIAIPIINLIAETFFINLKTNIDE